ncbi:non-specific serine/threonine protein kinase [Entamoeba marina]
MKQSCRKSVVIPFDKILRSNTSNSNNTRLGHGRHSVDLSSTTSNVPTNITFIKCEQQVDVTTIATPNVVGVYFFNVQFGKKTVNLQRRFSHFRFLDHFLRTQYSSLTLDKLPTKAVIKNSSHPDIIQKRSIELLSYLKSVIKNPFVFENTVVSEWFSQPPDDSLVSFTTQKKSGYLFQESPLLKNWKKRYCVLTPDVLALFKCAKDLLMYGNPTTVICLNDCTVRPVFERGFNILSIKRNGMTLAFLKAESSEDFASWISYITDVITSMPEFVKKQRISSLNTSIRKSTNCPATYNDPPIPRSLLPPLNISKQHHFSHVPKESNTHNSELLNVYHNFQSEINFLYPSLLKECSETEFPHLGFFEELKNLEETDFLKCDLEKYYQKLLVISKEYNTYVSIQKVTWMFINLYKYYKHFTVNGDSKLQTLQECHVSTTPRINSSKQLVCRLCEHSYDLSHFSEHTKICELIVRGCVEETTCVHRIKLVTNYLKVSYDCGMISDDFHYTQLIEMIPDFDTHIVIEKLQKIADGMKTLCVDLTDIILLTFTRALYDLLIAYQNLFREFRDQTECKNLWSFISVLAHKGKQNMLLNAPSSTATLDDFDIIKKFSAGAYSRIYLVKKKSTGDVYAMKVMKKEDMIRKNVVDSVLVEKNFLAKAHNISVVKLFYAFQDDTNLYLVMEYCSGGDLATLLEHVGCLDEHAAKIYSAEICLSLHYIHNIGCIHKDVKPDNILINKFGHLVLTDFGLSSYGWVSKDSEGAQGLFCTPDYAAPELLISDSYSFASDYFALGCMIYEFLVGKPPFNAETPEMIFMNIRNGTYSWPDEIEISNDCKDLISQLLSNDPHNRPDFDVIKTHPFFNDINWNRLFEEDREDIFVPELEDDNDTGYFEDDRDMKIVHMNKDDTLHGKVDTKQPKKHIFGNFDVKNIENLIEENRRSYMEELARFEKEDL